MSNWSRFIGGAIVVLGLGTGLVAQGNETARMSRGPVVMVAFRQVVPWPAGTRMTLHVELPTGQRFEFPFRKLTESEKRSVMAESEVARIRARREETGPSSKATPAAGSDHAHSGSSKASPSVAPPVPEPMAGSHHAGSGSAMVSASPGPAPAAGSTHAGSGSTTSPTGPASPPAMNAAVSRRLGTHEVVVAVLPALMTGATHGPAFTATVALYGCSDGDHYSESDGRCPKHVRPLEAGLVPAFEAAAVLESGESITNVRLKVP